ncbi:MAG: quinone-dependent dihydroorotate dehydrogenase [Campylobacterales bacterium]
MGTIFEFFKPFIYMTDPEIAHNLTELIFRTARRCPLLFNWMVERNFVAESPLHQRLWGRDFYNPVGVAAGFDKNGRIIPAFPALGFGWGEVGAITPKPQSGNRRPRVWRFPQYEAVQNAFGFNNEGVEAIGARLRTILPFTIPIGANIGKNKDTPEEEAVEDYRVLVNKLGGVVDFFVVNISSPNTPGLRDLLNRDFVALLFRELKPLTEKPILLKLSPDLENSKIEELVEGALENRVDGIIVTNTTTNYSLIDTPIKKGGISGAPLKERSFEVLKITAKVAFGKVPIVSVGGIDSPEEAYRRITHGATLLQLYTPLIFKGPGIVGEINRGLLELLARDGFSSISEAVGSRLK